jgi:acyl-CoA reductase-like NAD-dependent aldehyde dehydrogenase
LGQFHDAANEMPRFDPASFQMPCGHFIGGRVVEAPQALTVHRPSDGRAHAALPLADASTVDAAVCDADAAHQRSDWARRAPRERARVLRSGIGKDLGRQAVEANLRHKSVLIDFGAT